MESENNQSALILKWITGKTLSNDILNGSDKLRNISIYLDLLKTQGRRTYLRLKDVNIDLIKEYLSVCSWDLLLDFLKKIIDELNVCHVCKVELQNINDEIFKCSRCLLYYHEKCENGRKLDNLGLSSQYFICKNCFFIAAA